MHKTHNESRFQQIQLKIYHHLHFVWGKEIQVILEIFSCVNRFEFHGNKPLELLMDPFGNTSWSKNLKTKMKTAYT